ncbi:MAG: DUF4824 family protein [Gammaproteobacteria bacterium]|nr:DUF4824 family protein [Gammaproteobacteria bacterium]
MSRLTIISAVLLLLVNVMVLAGVAYNRSDDKVTQLLLTERELSVVNDFSSADENSGMSLSINWSSLSRNKENKLITQRWGEPDWLSEDKLKQLGVDVDSIKVPGDDDRYRDVQSIEVVFVLEFDGDAYKTALTIAEKELAEATQKQQADADNKGLVRSLKNLKSKLERLQLSDTRLFIIDAGLDKQALIEKYSDKKQYLFISGELKPYWVDSKLTASVKDLFISRVHVPLPFSDIITRATQGEAFSNYGDEFIAPRYAVLLNLGKRLEPWIESVSDL